ncbi:hypothetical protein DESC_720031 [Desulfosarcina cetonica]|nr:hypothetical protein DESC_720031 [Desulfosarcina cetonica]
MRGSVNVGLKLVPRFGELAQLGQGKDLEPAAVGQDGMLPVHEAMQAAKPADDLGTGPQVEVVGVAQDNLGPGGFDFLGAQGLDRRLGADGHENRGLDGAVGGVKCSGPGAFGLCYQLKSGHSVKF